MFYVIDLDARRLLYVSPAYERIWGRPVSDLMSDLNRFLETIHPDDRPVVVAEQERQTRHEAVSVEYRIRRPDGAERWISHRAFAVRQDAGARRRSVGLAEDITERRRNEEALRERESRLRELNETLEQRVDERTRERNRVWELSQDLFAIVNRDGSLRLVNPAWARIFGHSTQDMLQRPFADLVHPEDRVGTEAMMDALRSGRSIEHSEHRLRCADGSYRWISWTAVAESDAFYAVGRDVTREKEREERLRRTQKIEAIGQLTGGVAHDFNNLLMVISGGLDMLTRHPDGLRRERVFDRMRQAVERAARLTRQLLAFSRRQALKPEPIDLRRHIGEMRELLDRSLRADVYVDTQFAAGLWPIEVDAPELELVLLNLCVNARDAMPDGGTVTIRAENAPALQDGELQGDFVRLSVIDPGTGMSPEVLTRVFEPFFTTKDVGKGSGLGLAQVHGFAQQSGGGVRIVSEPGRGTTITLLLPRSHKVPQDTKHPVTVLAPEPRTRSRGHVLLVEDDEEVAALVADMVDQLGYEVTRTSNPVAALGALANGRGVDLVFSDVMMPGPMNGVDLAREARRRRPGLPVLLTSGYAASAKRDAEAERIALLPKPYRLEELDAAITATLTRRDRDENPRRTRVEAGFLSEKT